MFLKGTPQSLRSMKSWDGAIDAEMPDADPKCSTDLISRRSEGAGLASQTPRGAMERRALILSRLLAESANQNKTDWQAKVRKKIN